MNEKYIASIYQKFPINDNIMVFRRTGIIKNAVINSKDDIDEITYYNDNMQRVTLEYMDNDYVMVSDDQYCFGYPITMKDLSEKYPEYILEEELIEKYAEEISKVMPIGYYDEEKDKVKILFTNEVTLKQQEEDELFNGFGITYESVDKSFVSISTGDLKKIYGYLLAEDYDTLKEKFEYLNSAVDQIQASVMDVVEVKVFPEEQEAKKIDKTEIENSLKKLNNLIGLKNVKDEISKLIMFLLFKSKSNKYLDLQDPNLHMFFTGNPGTGKTTVARILGEILYSLGYTKSNKFIEITPKDLIAGYVGQTAIKTAEVIKENNGGIIFIDEAYTLASQGQHFSNDALAEILKELEKKNTIFIFAGYKKEMDDFIRLNPGLRSRVGYYLEYQDYNEEELYQIFESKINKIGFKMTDGLREKIKENIKKAKNDEHFGNGRYIDKLVEKIELEHAINVKNKKRKDKLITLTENDLTPEIEDSLTYKIKTKKIGF